MLPIIAVMFTFSFSSAFATADYSKGLANEYFNLAMNAVKEAGEITVDGYVVDYATLEANRADLLEAAYASAKASNPDKYVTTADDIKALLEAEANQELEMTIVAAQFAADKAEALAILNGLSVSDYSTEEMDEVDDDGCKTYQEHVQYLINEAVKDINDADDFTTDSDVDAYVTAKGTIDGFFGEFANDNLKDGKATFLEEKGYKGGIDGETKIGLGVYVLNNAYKVGEVTLNDYTTDAVNAKGAISTANVAAVKAAIASKYAAYLAKKDADKTFAANMKKVLDFLAEEKVDLGLEGEDTDYFVYDTYADKVATAIANVKALEAEAAQLAAEKDVNGALVRDAEDVADIVTEGTVDAYKYAVGLNDKENGKAYYVNKVDALYASLDEAKLAYTKKLRETYIANLLEGFEDDETYYPLELAKVKALTDEYLAKVNAVTDIAKVGNYDAKYLGTAFNYTNGGSLGDILTAEEVNAKTSDLKDMAAQYVEFLNGQIKKEADQYYAGKESNDKNDYAKLNSEVEKLVGNSEARTAKEISALSDQVIALVKSLPTKAAVEAADDAAAAAIKALPTTVTTADKAVIDAAVAAIKAYKDMTAVDYATKSAVDDAVTKYAYAYNNELTDKVKAVSTTDKAALKALVDEIDAFVDTYDNDGAFVANKGTLEGYLEKIQKTEAAAVRTAISAIPVNANLTDASKDKVEAARALYDAYVAEYTDYEDYEYNYTVTTTEDGFVADDFDYAALAKAETLLGITATEKADENAKAYVQDLSIKARSTKTSKGIKVTINANVQPLLDAGFTVEYKFYRSTKSNKNYGTAKITKTENTYLNTSGKKGTKYFYKVKLVVKNAAGEVVATTPLTQCLYATRTF